ncbi:hypothetical protein DENIS_4677 [Desulfonema ishimotonii]|uniref:HAD family phosphatase n=1 Tax=Desulfonema ishimotonii TaxID=45657 RepID=A0A401G360_9BACT|nr:HAD hydrolase family protein [Desulfonema ishimotonii]GBC63679.1 hypothetical protein DENIS_4677 [Desulfonema ishimotonii]
MNAKALVVDLDGTLLHAEAAAIPVRGRSGYRYMSRTSAALLTDLSHLVPVVIATGRNARSVDRLVAQLGQIPFSGFVMENGLIARQRVCRDNIPEDPWADLFERLPGWERLAGYESCLGMIFPPDMADPEAVVRDALACLGLTAHIYRERHKLFVYPFPASKLAGIEALNFDPFIVLGDEINDMDMLRAGAYPGTIASAHQRVRQYIREAGSYCSPSASHAGTEDLLRWAGAIARKNCPAGAEFSVNHRN